METIECAAIQFNGEIFSAPRPGRHHTVFKIIFSEPENTFIKAQANEIQGFLTSLGRFVDRIEGAEIALKSGQITKLSWPPNLYSEDLW